MSIAMTEAPFKRGKVEWRTVPGGDGDHCKDCAEKTCKQLVFDCVTKLLIWMSFSRTIQEMQAAINKTLGQISLPHAESLDLRGSFSGKGPWISGSNDLVRCMATLLLGSPVRLVQVRWRMIVVSHMKEPLTG
jgi:hypothetical protein